LVSNANDNAPDVDARPPRGGLGQVHGAVLIDSVQGDALSFETHLEIDSPEPPEKVARLICTAERGCFVMQALLKPMPLTSTTSLNGQPLALT
jgi:hypothetical protein